ncbi:MAG TPA: nitroreductase/quinone reductase family protein [Candidatus Margulisiibacteriota bacterium]|nr:nitroreductase/quinone reductase family protein [Candidatus Margulisiibacteriota bacterium]
MTQEPLKQRLAALQDLSTLELTTIGRKTGKRHTVTTWFLVEGETVYLVTLRLRRDWPRNLKKNGRADLQIAGKLFKGHAKQILDTKRLEHVKALLSEKYWAAWLGSWFGMGPEGAFAVTVDA